MPRTFTGPRNESLDEIERFLTGGVGVREPSARSIRRRIHYTPSNVIQRAIGRVMSRADHWHRPLRASTSAWTLGEASMRLRTALPNRPRKLISASLDLQSQPQ